MTDTTKPKHHDRQHHQYQISLTQMSCFSNYILTWDSVHPFAQPVLTGCKVRADKPRVIGSGRVVEV